MSSSRSVSTMVIISIVAIASCAWLAGLNVGLERRPVPPEPMTVAEVLEQVKALQKRLSEMTPAEREEFDRRMASSPAHWPNDDLLQIEHSLGSSEMVGRAKTTTPGSLTLTQMDVASPIYTDGQVTLLEFSLEANGETMLFKMPRVVFRKTGGAPWRNLGDMEGDIFLPFAWWRGDGPGGVIGPDKNDEGRSLKKLTLIDENSVAVDFPQDDRNSIVLRPKERSFFRVTVILRRNTDVQVLSASMEAGSENVTGLQSKEKLSTGAVVGSALTVASQNK